MKATARSVLNIIISYIYITNALHMNIGVCIVIHIHMAFYSMYVLLGALSLSHQLMCMI